MVNIFQSDTPFLVFLIMGCVSLILSLYFHWKSRLLVKFSKNLSVNVFDKTFNVFDPYPERRNSMEISILLPLFPVLMYFFIGFVVLKIFEAGLVLGLTLFILSFGLMMADEAIELYTNTKVFIKAVGNGANFGKGDLGALSLLTETLPKFNRYYVVLAAVFFTFAVAFPYIAPAVLMVFSLYVGTAIESTSSVGVWSPYIVVLAFTILFMSVYFAAGRLKNRLFGFSPSVPLTAMEEQFERIKIMAHWAETPPFELSHRPVVEDPETEERKRRALRSEK